VSPVLPQSILRSFDLKSTGPQDDAVRPWLSGLAGITSSSQNPLEGTSSFLFAPDGDFSTAPISMHGANTVRAAQVQVAFSYATANAPSPVIPILKCFVSFDGGAEIAQTMSLSANASWARRSFQFDVPPTAQTCTVGFVYVGGSGAPSCYFDNINILVIANADLPAYLASKYDEVCWLCAHNAFANYQDGWLFAQQSFNVTTQLQQGVRALMLDIDDENGDIYLLHAGWTTSMVLRPGFSDFRRLVETLTEVNVFLDQNPNEIVTIFFESDVKDSNQFPLIVQAFQNAGSSGSNLLQKVFRYDQANTGAGGQTWNVAAQGAPTLQWMVSANRRCVVFSSLRGGDTNSVQSTAPDGWAKVWHFVRENVYGNDSLVAPQWCDQRAESRDADVNQGRTLTLLNHFPDWAVGSILPASISFSSINDADFLEQHVDQWVLKYPRLPNFIAVDYASTGANGGALNLVRSLNRRWADHDVHINPPPIGPLLQVGPTLAAVKADLISTIATSSLVAAVVTNATDSDLVLLGSYASHGKIQDNLPAAIPGRNADAVRMMNGDGSAACAGVCTVALGMVGPQCFWLFSAAGTAQVLFVAVSSPYNLLMYSNYANARWIDRTPAVDAFISSGAGGDALFDSLFQETSNDTSTCADLRIRARPWICSTWAMSNRTPGDMTVTLWNY